MLMYVYSVHNRCVPIVVIEVTSSVVVVLILMTLQSHTLVLDTVIQNCNGVCALL